MWTDPLAAFPLTHPAGNLAQELEYRQIFFDNKIDLERAIETTSRYGWRLLTRSYSSERGHGANLVRPRMHQAA